MDIQSVSLEIYKYIDKLREKRNMLKQAGINKAQTKSDYYKQRALVIMKLKNGIVMELEGVKIINPPATVMKEIAKGICYQESIDRDIAESEYKSLIIKIESMKAELNALQSVNRYLEYGVKK